MKRSDCIAFNEHRTNYCVALKDEYFCTDSCPFYKKGTDMDRRKRELDIERYMGKGATK